MLHREMNRLFDDVFRSTPVPFDQSGETIVPQVNVSETDKELRVTAELPGVSERDIDVTVDGDVLTIRAEKKAEREGRQGEEETIISWSALTEHCSAALRLPFSVDPGRCRHNFENGVLTITLPKPQGQEQARKIAVQKGARNGGETQQASGQTQQNVESAAQPSIAVVRPGFIRR